MLIVILSLSKIKEFVKEILYELFSPKGTYLTAKGTKYCRNCSHNSIQFVSRTMMFVKTCRITLRILWQNPTLCYLHTVSKSKWNETFTHWSRHPLPDTFLLVLIKRVWMRLSSRKSVCDTPSAIHSTCSRGADVPLWRSQPRSATFCEFLHLKV